MATYLTTAMSRPGTVPAFDVLARAKALEASGPHDHSPGGWRADFTAPQHITEAAIEGPRAGQTQYVPAPGIRSCVSRAPPSWERTGRLIMSRTKLLIVNSRTTPYCSAPTKVGSESIAEITIRHDLTVFSDEVHRAGWYEGAAQRLRACGGPGWGLQLVNNDGRERNDPT